MQEVEAVMPIHNTSWVKRTVKSCHVMSGSEPDVTAWLCYAEIKLCGGVGSNPTYASMFGCEDKWLELFGCKILYFTPSSEHGLTFFDTTDLHDLKLVFNPFLFCRQETRLKYQLSPIGCCKSHEIFWPIRVLYFSTLKNFYDIGSWPTLFFRSLQSKISTFSNVNFKL